MNRIAVLALLVGLWGLLMLPLQSCSTPPTGENPLADAGSNPDKTVKGKTIKRKYTYRIIAGVSMGGAMSSIIGARNPEKFDIIGSMGAPNNFSYLLKYIRESLLGGFCGIKKLEQSAKDGKLGAPSSYCAKDLPKPRYEYEYFSHYNNWHYDDAGGNWNRSHLLRVLQDLSTALGNPAFNNPKSAYWPHPSIPNNWRTMKDRCKNPIIIKNYKHYRFNPEGKYNVITFCDGNRNRRDGIFDPAKTNEHTVPVEIALAVDINGNGKRDYGEPVIAPMFERYDDFGVDGCTAEREDGKGGCVAKGKKGPGGKDPNKDDYDPIKNPSGTEKNDIYDKGEPYKDFGLDGIDGTKDFGEGDKKFTQSPGYANFMKHSPRDLLRKFSRKQLDRLNVYVDAGIRDLFNFHIGSLHLFASLKSKYPEEPKRVQLFDQFVSLMPKGETDFDYTKIDWSDKGQHPYIRYGNPKATKVEIEQHGDGDHVGGAGIIFRIFTFFSFLGHHIPDADFSVEASPNKKAGEGIATHYVYDSKALKAKQIYSVVLPPGFTAHPEKRYPVVYFGHGYGMSGPDMSNILVLLSYPMQQGQLAKAILVSLHGKCEQWLPKPENSKSFNKTPGVFGKCHRGTFYVDAKGVNGAGAQMEKAFFEIVGEVEKKFKSRIRQPEVRDYVIPVKP